jgi:hypothetical protein
MGFSGKERLLRERSMRRFIHRRCAGFEDHEEVFSRILTRLNSLWVVAKYPFGGMGRNLSLHCSTMRVRFSRCLAPHI